MALGEINGDYAALPTPHLLNFYLCLEPSGTAVPKNPAGKGHSPLGEGPRMNIPRGGGGLSRAHPEWESWATAFRAASATLLRPNEVICGSSTLSDPSAQGGLCRIHSALNSQ